MKAEVTVTTPSYLNPFLDRPTQKGVIGQIRKFITILFAMISGEGISKRNDDGGHSVVTLEYAQAPAVAGVTVAAPANAGTVTLNGTALTGGQYRASGTVTFAAAADGDTVTVNGVVLTAKTSPSGSYQFARGVSNTADAAAFVACLNALTLATNDAASAGIQGLIEATSAAAVATLYAITEGTAGNALTLASSSNTTLAVSGATLANGAAAANNGFDRIGNNSRTARSIVANLALSSTAILNQQLLGACRSGIVTCLSVLSGMTVSIGDTVLRAVGELTDSGGNRITTFADNVFSIATTDTTCAVALVNCINNHPKLRERYYATNSSGVVTIRERPPEGSKPATLSTSSGTALAVTATVNGCFADSALVLFQATHPGPTGNAQTIATSSGTTLAIDGAASRLAGGTSTTQAF